MSDSSSIVRRINRENIFQDSSASKSTTHNDFHNSGVNVGAETSSLLTTDTVNKELDELKGLANYTKSIALVLHDQISANNAYLNETVDNIERTSTTVESATNKAKNVSSA